MCALQAPPGQRNGELTMIRIQQAGGQVIECGNSGSCMFDSFLVNAHLNTNATLRIAVSRPARRPANIFGRIC